MPIASAVIGFNISWVKESTQCTFLSEETIFKQNYVNIMWFFCENTRIIGYPIYAKLPTLDKF